MPQPALLVTRSEFAHLPTVTDSSNLVFRRFHDSAAYSLAMEEPNLGVLVSNEPNYGLFSEFRRKHPKARTILVTDIPMKDYAVLLHGEQADLVDHIIANKDSNSFTSTQLSAALLKISTSDIFGVEKYLAPGTEILRDTLRANADRETINSRVMKFSESHHLSRQITRHSYGITEEFLMNAVYDAPAAAGIPRFQNLESIDSIVLEPSEYGELSFGFDGKVFAISMSDPFGAMKRQTWMSYLHKVLKNNAEEDIFDHKKIGGGIGLYKTLCSSHALICNLSAFKRTEVIALINVEQPLDGVNYMTRSISFFDVDDHDNTRE